MTQQGPWWQGFSSWVGCSCSSEIGARIGTLPTIALIIVTGMIGASLARLQGLGVLRDLQHEIDLGRLPAQVLMDGVLVLLASALLITPEFSRTPSASSALSPACAT